MFCKEQVSNSLLDEYLNEMVLEGWFPGVVYSVLHNKQVLARNAIGYAQVIPTKIKVSTNTLFDLASLTKPIVTAISTMILVEQKKLSLDTFIKVFFPQFDENPKSGLTVKHLLTHSTGLPAWAPAYIHGSTPGEIMDYLLNLPLETPPGAVVYGCPNYIVLGRVIEIVSGTTLDKFAQRHIFRPLKMYQTMFQPGKHLPLEIAATEWGTRYESLMVGAPGNNYSGWRKNVIKSVVHDQNSYSLGGVSGNAGLFSSVHDLGKIVALFLKWYAGGKIISPSTIDYMVEEHVSSSDQRRGLGWKLKGSNTTVFGNLMSSNSFGHSGFTGCSMFMDPEKDLGTILLTNRVHPFCYPEGIDHVRSRFNDLVIETFFP